MISFKRLIFLIPAFTVLVMLSGQCLFIGHPAGQGPAGSVFQSTTMGSSANDISSAPGREGRSCTQRLFFFLFALGFTWGEGTVQAAAQDGNINKIQSIDLEQLNVLSIYSRQCTVVKGN